MKNLAVVMCASRKHKLLTLPFLLMIVQFSLPVQSDGWVTVLAMKNGSTDGNVYDLLTSAGALNNASGKELLRVEDIVVSGDFKSSMLDQWSTFLPSAVRLVLFDEDGYMVWFATFYTPGGSGKDPSLWAVTSAFHLSSDSRLNKEVAEGDVTIVFDGSKLTMTDTTDNNCRLQLTWNPGPPSYLFSLQFSVKTPPSLSAPVYQSMETMVLAQYLTTSPMFYLTNNYGFTVHVHL